ncbi:MAG: DNA adenine methylase [Myxococcales bacterium]|nr:DNA adenine methylase [Myxococcales bacterium]
MAGPIVKWVGGKGRLLPQLRALLPPRAAQRRHVEPFVGGAALFFHRNPRRAVLSDINPSLIAMYRAVRDNLDSVVRHLRRLARSHSTEHYYATRERYNTAPLAADERAATFIYLNKTCFNGLHRVNRRGHFNVPIGRYDHPKILDEAALRLARTRLKGAQLRCGSFEETSARARPGDFVYLDPPYAPVSPTANFTGYAAEGFGPERQLQLRDVFQELDRRGCLVMLSNSAAPSIRKLYRGYSTTMVSAPRSVNSRGDRRGRVAEVVVCNYDAASHGQGAVNHG